MSSASAVSVLCNAFYSSNLSISQRSDIINVLLTAITRLSTEKVPEGLGAKPVEMGAIRIRSSDLSLTVGEHVLRGGKTSEVQHSRHWW